MTAVEVKTALVKVQGSHPKTATRTRAALSALFSFCIGHGWRQGNPCDRAVWRSLSPPAPKSVPYPMLPLKLLPSFWQRLLDRDTVPSLALAFTIAVAARQAETTGLVWDDLDLDARLMIVPAAQDQDAARAPTAAIRRGARRARPGQGQGAQIEPCLSRAGRLPHGFPYPVEPHAPSGGHAVLGPRRRPLLFLDGAARDDRFCPRGHRALSRAPAGNRRFPQLQSRDRHRENEGRSCSGGAIS